MILEQQLHCDGVDGLCVLNLEYFWLPTMSARVENISVCRPLSASSGERQVHRHTIASPRVVEI